MKKTNFVIFEQGYSLVDDLSVVPKDIIKSVHKVEDKLYSRAELEKMYADRK